jgi:hypothetical protein
MITSDGRGILVDWDLTNDTINAGVLSLEGTVRTFTDDDVSMLILSNRSPMRLRQANCWKTLIRKYTSSRTISSHSCIF